jgi:hypothetical protein
MPSPSFSSSLCNLPQSPVSPYFNLLVRVGRFSTLLLVIHVPYPPHFYSIITVSLRTLNRQTMGTKLDLILYTITRY